MRVVTVLGTRPEIIRLSLIVPKLDRLVDHILVHTGQNFDPALSDLFFEELAVRSPDIRLDVRGGPAEQIGQILARCEQVFLAQKPDRLLILGDTNSGLSAFIAKRLGIPVFHMEAGNRGYDDRIPEEVNRRVIDHSSDILMPYTERSRDNLLREGIPGNRILVTGNPIAEVIGRFQDRIDASTIHDRLGVAAQGYLLVTLHRAENVDLPERFSRIVEGLRCVGRELALPVLVSTHPRTRARLDEADLIEAAGNVRFLEPFGFLDFVKLELSARAVLSDSGTVQEECSIFGIPNVTIRDVTERPETIECGSNILSGSDPADIVCAARLVLDLPPRWTPPVEYQVKAVSDTVLRIVCGHHHNLPVPVWRR